MQILEYTVVVGDSDQSGPCPDCNGYTYRIQMTGIHPTGVQALPDLLACPDCESFKHAALAWRHFVETTYRNA